MKLAIFDLDHTLMPMDTGDCWIRYVVRRSGIDPAPVIGTLDRFAREYSAGMLDIDEYIDFHMKLLLRLGRKAMDQYRADYLKCWIKPNILPSSLALVDSYVKAGDDVVVCTATYHYLTSKVAELLGVNKTLAMLPETDETGEFTGRIIGGHTFQSGKIRAVKELLESRKQEGRDYDEVVFYSDSHNDIPLFEYVESLGGTCIMVNPNSKLRAFGEEKGWKEIENYTADDLKRAARPIEIS